MKRRIVSSLAGVGALALALLAVVGTAAAAPPTTCSGTAASPGVLAGSYSTVFVSGACVAGGPTTVAGNLILLPGSALLASTDFTVTGNVEVRSGATLVGGEEEDEEAPAQAQAILFHVSGNLTATHSLGVVLHGAGIGGNVTETGGGGGFTCEPSGIFAQFDSPVFSVYEGSHIGGKVTVTGVNSCWLGITHSQIDGGVRVLNNQLADPDAIEILDNHIGGNLVCEQNSMTWDSHDILEDSLYPRGWDPNTVDGHRVGQCVVAPPLTPGGASPGAF